MINEKGLEGNTIKKSQLTARCMPFSLHKLALNIRRRISMAPQTQGMAIQQSTQINDDPWTETRERKENELNCTLHRT